ncbi:hypothetical protein [Heyndrickxia sp. FSL W8-0423]|uniref:hypothetical protein n=1 Tax=Heyndrickxia sp. FSL W8-0423 TaxID=2921601 RepID=UPI0030F6FCC7
MITVTMPISEYEQMKKRIDRLQRESIYNYIKREYSDLERNEYEIKVDFRPIIKTLEKENKPIEIKRI